MKDEPIVVSFLMMNASAEGDCSKEEADATGYEPISIELVLLI
jgi:hypothetical protein